jgi:hypothetical protein
MSHQTAQVLEKKVKFLAERTGLETKEGESPVDPYDPRVSHQISHYLQNPRANSAYPESPRLCH